MEGGPMEAWRHLPFESLGEIRGCWPLPSGQEAVFSQKRASLFRGSLSPHAGSKAESLVGFRKLCKAELSRRAFQCSQ